MTQRRPYPINLIENPFLGVAIPSEYKDLAEAIIVPEDPIKKYIKFHARELDKKYSHVTPENPLILLALRLGAQTFAALLEAYLTISHASLGITAGSYGSGTESKGYVRVDPDELRSLVGVLGNFANPELVKMEDIWDTGFTLDRLANPRARREYILDPRGKPIDDDTVRLLEIIQVYKPSTSVLLEKPERREVESVVDWIGFTIPNRWVNGFGLDTDGKYREAHFVWAMKQ